MIDTSNRPGMIMRYPATRWQDALPTGSGVVGALVYGKLQKETIILNHEEFFYPIEPPEEVDVSDQLPIMRTLIAEGEYRQAAQLLRDEYSKRKATKSQGGLAPFQPFCALNINQHIEGVFKKYRRGIDFSSGRAWVTWIDEGGEFIRETFVSRVTDTVCHRIRCNKPGQVSVRIGLDKVKSEQGDREAICHSSGAPTEPETVLNADKDAQTVSFVGTLPNGLTFGAVGCVTTVGGTVEAAEDVLVIANADEVIIKIELFYDKDPKAELYRLTDELTKSEQTYSEALAEHLASHGRLFDQVHLKLGGETTQTNEELLAQAYDGEVPTELLKTMFDYGRYLLLSSSKVGGLPSHLQGLWNGDYFPAWNCDYHTDENIQMNYWLCGPSGLAEAGLPLFDYFETYMDDFRNNAQNNFGCRGIQVPLAMTKHGRTNPDNYGYWTAAAGWIAQHLYDYYLFTGDRETLKTRIVPWLKEVALFYEDFLIEDESGCLQFIPSYSPENRPANINSVVTINATMDVAICKEVLTNLCSACEELGIEPENIPKWRGILDKLPAYQVNEDGAIMEWLHPAFDENYHHRHQSHVYPVFPGFEITEESNPDIFEACRIAVEKRMVVGLKKQSGWSMAHMANSFARLGQGDRALEALEILTRCGTGPNLFTYHNDWRSTGLTLDTDHPPFQIDANLGIASAVLEMLVFSKPGLVKLLPALPTKWQTGEVTGIHCRGGIVVDMKWDIETGMFSATLASKTDQQVRIRLPEFVKKVDVQPAANDALDSQSGGLLVQLFAGEALTATSV